MQTSVSAMDTAVEGALADNTNRKHADPKRNAEATDEIIPGLMCARVGETAVERLDALADAMAGIPLFGQSYDPQYDLGTDGFKPDAVFDVLQKGRVSVIAEDVVAMTSGVYVRMTDGQGSAALVVADFTFTAEADDDKATKVAHGLETGDGPIRVANSGGALPTGISAATDYWVIKVDADTFKFATTRALAQAGTAINLTTDGTGTQTLSDTATTQRIVTGRAGAFRGTPDGSPVVIADITFVGEADDDLATAAAHGLQTGDGPVRVSNSGGALPTGLLAATDYWIIRVSANTFKFASSLANAIAGTGINLTTDGTGTQTLADTVDTERLSTRNISKLARWRSATSVPGQFATLEIDMTKIALASL